MSGMYTPWKWKVAIFGCAITSILIKPESVGWVFCGITTVLILVAPLKEKK